jgi:hypothetical protein
MKSFKDLVILDSKLILINLSFIPLKQNTLA